MTRKPNWRIKNEIQAALRLRPMSLSELSRVIDSDISTTKRHLEELKEIGNKCGYPVIIATQFSGFRGCAEVTIYSTK